MANYETIEELVVGVANATQLVTNTKYDDNSYTISEIPEFVKYKGASVSTIYANGNSWIGFDAESEHFKYNRRDAAMYNLWTEVGTYLDTYNFFRVRWGGMCKYDAYGDPYKQTFDLVIFDTGDVMLYAVDIPTSYYDGTFYFADVAYNAPTTDTRYATFYAQEDGTYRIEYAPIELGSASIIKYLVRDSGKLYTVTDGALAEVTGTLNAELFQSSGADDIPDGALLISLTAPEVLCWTNAEELPKLTATVQGMPTGSHDIISDNIPVGDSNIYGISNVYAISSDGVTFLLSFDGGAWMSYNNEKWSASNVGMTRDELVAIPEVAWTSVINSATYMQLKATINGMETVTKVEFNFNNSTENTLPDGYIVCKYLESTGTQWIDTDITPIFGDAVYLRVERTVMQSPLFYAGTNNQLTIYPFDNTYTYTKYFQNTTAALYFDYNYFSIDGKFHDLLFDKNGCSVDGVSVCGISNNRLASDTSLRLFRNNTLMGSTRIASLRLERDNNVICNLIPALDNNGTPCFYDTISKKTLYNKGSGSFLYATYS